LRLDLSAATRGTSGNSPRLSTGRGGRQSIDCAPEDTFLSGIDPIGRMVGGMTTADGHLHGLLVMNGVCTAVDYPGSTASYANSINPRGDIAGRYTVCTHEDRDLNAYSFNRHGFSRELFSQKIQPLLERRDICHPIKHRSVPAACEWIDLIPSCCPLHPRPPCSLRRRDPLLTRR
jgi:hypothetical protein